MMSRWLRRIKNDREGATIIEFAVVALPLFILMFGIIEFGVIMFERAMLEDGVASAARMGKANAGQYKCNLGQVVQALGGNHSALAPCNYGDGQSIATIRNTILARSGNYLNPFFLRILAWNRTVAGQTWNNSTAPMWNIAQAADNSGVRNIDRNDTRNSSVSYQSKNTAQVMEDNNWFNPGRSYSAGGRTITFGPGDTATVKNCPACPPETMNRVEAEQTVAQLLPHSQNSLSGGNTRYGWEGNKAWRGGSNTDVGDHTDDWMWNNDRSAGGTGQEGEVVLYTVMYDHYYMTPLIRDLLNPRRGLMTLTTAVAVKNEPAI